jgi:predicted ester cyclase
MSTETNKAIVRRYIEQVFNEGRTDLLEEFLAEEFDSHTNLPPGPEGVKTFYAVSISAFPDQQTTIDDVFAEGNEVVVRATFKATHLGELFGIPPTARPVTMSWISIYRLANGKIVEHWYQEDKMGLMQQLGVIPTPESQEL